MKNILSITLIMFVSVFFMFIGQNNLSAATLTENKHDNIWFLRGPDATHTSGSSRFAEYYIDGDVTYCIEPGVQIDTHNYNEIGWINSPYSPEINLKLNLIAYYGYGYPGHEDLRYRMATQFLIWKTTSTMSFKYTTEASGAGTYIDISKEENDIMALVNTHYNLPSFNNEIKDTIIGKSVTFTDTVGTLSRYEIMPNVNVTGSINGNTLTLTPNKAGEFIVQLRIKKFSNKPTTLFGGVDGKSQKQGRFNLDDPLAFSVKLNVSGASLEIIKKDFETNMSKPQGDGSLAGAKYELLDENRNHVTYLITDEFGHGKTENILQTNKNYILKEVLAPEGYLLDSKEYIVSIGNELEVEFEVQEDVIKKEVEIIKVFANGNTGILTPEANITFDIFLKSTGEYYKSVTTSSTGYASIFLPYGVWIWKQKNSSPNYEKVDDFEVEVKDTIGKISKYLSNAEIQAKIKIVKVDADSQKVIVRKGLKFKIKNLDTNEYVTQTITYPTPQTIEIFEMDENGIIITPYALPSGHYALEELENQMIDGYVWNSEPLLFEIGENSEFIQDEVYGTILVLKFANEQVMGELIINKLGEKLIIENDTFRYEEIKLDGVHFELYADADIYSQDGTLIYKNKDLVASFYTQDGFYKVDKLYLGKYCLKEKSSVGNHVLDESSYCFELKYEDQYTKTINYTLNLKNYLKKGTLEFTKTDIAGNPLPNTTITIYTDNDNEERKLIFKGKTDSQGKIIINGLFASKFVMYESEAPEGYILNPEPMRFEIKENGEIVKCSMINEKIDVPITELNKNYIMEILGTILLLGGIGAIIYAKKRH